MLSKEEVLDILAYCKEHGVNRKDRIRELGLTHWAFYKARRKYLEDEGEEGQAGGGRFIQLSTSGQVVPESVSGMERRVNPAKRLPGDKEVASLEIECRTPRGGMLRISGPVTPALLSTLLQSI